VLSSMFASATNAERSAILVCSPTDGSKRLLICSRSGLRLRFGALGFEGAEVEAEAEAEDEARGGIGSGGDVKEVSRRRGEDMCAAGSAPSASLWSSSDIAR
jgi:hypothetical protein